MDKLPRHTIHHAVSKFGKSCFAEVYETSPSSWADSPGFLFVCPLGDGAVNRVHASRCIVQNCRYLGKVIHVGISSSVSQQWSNGVVSQCNSNSCPQVSTLNTPDSFDWRNETPTPVNEPKDQAQCGSCWAFSSVANVEGVAVVQGNQMLQSLSEQELVDCSQSDNGCGGGLQPRAFEDMINGPMGLVLESDYPYTSQTGEVGACKVSDYTQQVFINSWTSIAADEAQMAAATVQYGPLAVALNATPMQFYFGGVSNPSDCSPFGIDHAVNIVGFGNDAGDDYWIIRNSWGASWGENGYYRLIRGIGACGIDQIVSTAIINSAANVIV